MLTLVPEEVERYAERHTTPLPPLLDDLVAETEREMGGLAVMLSGQVEGQFLQMLVAVSGAKRVLEIGMFTGFSAQMMAAALPEDGRIVTCELNDKSIAFAQRFFARSPHGKKIDVRAGPALDTLKTLDGPFDLVFIDADKTGYIDYYEASLALLAPRGLIVADNCLRQGNVLDPQDDGDRAIVAFNDHVQRDDRVTNVLLTIRDGVMLIRRK